ASQSKKPENAKKELITTPTKAPSKIAKTTSNGDINVVSKEAWIWPVQGQRHVLHPFGAIQPNHQKNRGINIAGKEGDPIQAVADGEVVYSGNALRGYGNLIIIKHNEKFLTA